MEADENNIRLKAIAFGSLFRHVQNIIRMESLFLARTVLGTCELDRATFCRAREE